MKKKGNNIVKEFSETSTSGNQGSKKELGSVLEMHNSLLQEYGNEIVTSALQSLEIIGKFLDKSLDVKNTYILQDICKHLSLYGDKEKYHNNFGMEFGSSDAALTYVFAQTVLNDKKHLIMGKNDVGDYYDFLQKYISKDAKCADLFCGSNKGMSSSIQGTVLLFSLLGINKLLAVDLFNQHNEIKTNMVDPNYGYHYYLPDVQTADFLPSENILADDRNHVYPKFDLCTVKLDSCDALQAMPDNSLDVIMINNVDQDIVGDPEYRKKLRSEVKRVVRNKGFVFGFCTTIRPHDVAYLRQDKQILGFGLTAFENNK